MSVLAIDIGSMSSVIATIKRGAVNIIRNDLSERLTPSLVAFSNNERNIGEAAQTSIKSNFKNTCRYFKQLMGLTMHDENDIRVEKEFSLAPLDFLPESEGGLVGYRVTYQNENTIITPTQCLAALLTSLKGIAEKSIGFSVSDVVISVPVWYSEKARQAVLDAAQVAGLVCLRAMNEHAAVALDYGIYRARTFNAEKPTRVMFVGMGHGSTFVSIVEFVPDQLKVLASETDKLLGGRNMDLLIMHYLSLLFEKQYKLDPTTNSKARLKLEEAASRAKKVLSANTETSINIDCLIEDYELSTMLSRQTFEKLCEGLHNRLIELLRRTLEAANLTVDSIDSLEIVGGGCRTPWVQQALNEFFVHRISVSKTLSMDETVARGCALQGAMLYPRYKVREFHVLDKISEPITVSYLSTSGTTPEMKTGVLFEKGSVLGSKRWLTFTRSSDFDIKLKSGANESPVIVHIHVPAEAVANDLPKRIKVGVLLTINGTIECETAQLQVNEEVIESPALQSNENQGDTQLQLSPKGADVPADAPQQPLNDNTGTAPTADNAKVSEPKKKVKTRRYDCKLVTEPRFGYIQPDVKDRWRNIEVAMMEADMKCLLLRQIINDLETYIYTTKHQLESSLAPYATEHELTTAFSSLQSSRDWIDGIDQETMTYEMYQEQLDKLKQICEPISLRYSKAEQRAFELQEFKATCDQLRANLTPEKLQTDWSHVTQDKLAQMNEKLNMAENWLQSLSTKIQETPLYNESVDPKSIREENELLINFSKTVFVDKPVPQSPELQREGSQPGEPDIKAKADQSSQFPSTQESADPDKDVPMSNEQETIES